MWWCLHNNVNILNPTELSLKSDDDGGKGGPKKGRRLRNVVHSVVSNSLWAHGLQHARLPSPSPSPGACSNPCPSSRWCHPTVSSSVIPFSSCPQSFLASGSFPMGWLFALHGQSIGASASVLPMSIQGWSSPISHFKSEKPEIRTVTWISRSPVGRRQAWPPPLSTLPVSIHCSSYSLI